MKSPEQTLTKGPPKPGDKVGPYQVMEIIGVGGNATVFRAVGPNDENVALKILQAMRITSEETARFKREFSLTAKISHPNIVSVIDAGAHGDFPWLSMELVDGSDLEHLIEQWKQSPSPERFPKIERIFSDILSALGEVHRHGLVHRDIKPTNIMISHDGKAMLSDFGVVKKIASHSTELTKAGRLVGTVAYMSPEQIASETVDTRSDLYSLGAVLYQMLTLRRPIDANTITGFLARHLTEVPTPPRDLDDTIPPKLAAIAKCLLHKSPSQRYSSTDTIEAALNQISIDITRPLRGRSRVIREWSSHLNQLPNNKSSVGAIIGDMGVGKSHLLKVIFDEAIQKKMPAVIYTETDPEMPGTVRDLLKSSDVPVLVAIDDIDLCSTEEIIEVSELINLSHSDEYATLALIITATEPKGQLQGLLDGSLTGDEALIHQLEPLDQKAISLLMRDLNISGRAADSLSHRLHREHHGFPQAIIDTVTAMEDSGWLERVGELLRIAKPLKVLLSEPLPSKPEVAKRFEAILATLTPQMLEIVSLISLAAHPIEDTLIFAATDAAITTEAINAIIKTGLIKRQTIGLTVSHPVVIPLVRTRLSDAQKISLHLKLATALRPRRRDASDLIAHHLIEAGSLNEAVPYLIAAARRASRKREYGSVIKLCQKAEACNDESRSDVHNKHQRWLYILWGEALLARIRFKEAEQRLRIAVDLSMHPTNDKERRFHGRALSALGRSLYRQGALEDAAVSLSSARDYADNTSKEMASATRALADIKLMSGDLVESGRLWRTALDIAQNTDSIDAKARAQRGIAHLYALQGHLIEAANVLDEAEELITVTGDIRVRTGILLRSIELDIVGARYGSALHRTEKLLDLSLTDDASSKQPQALALRAELMLGYGDSVSARLSAKRAVAHAVATPNQQWEALLRAGHVLLRVGAREEAWEALQSMSNLPSNPMQDPQGYLAALQAWTIAEEKHDQAIQIAKKVTKRPGPMLIFRAAKTSLVLSNALRTAGDIESARECAKNGLSKLQGEGCDGLRLDLMLALFIAAPDNRLMQPISLVIQRIADNIAPNLKDDFLKREDIRVITG